MPGQALAGLHVVEFTDEIAAYGGRLLADLGAEVTKVEPPGGGRLRHTPPFYHGESDPDSSIAFWVYNTSKRSVVLDLDTAEGQAAAKKLVLSADIVLTDQPVGYLESRGLGYEALSAEKPALIYAQVTGFGSTGPHANWAYTDIVGQATGGVMTLAGEPADPPFRIYGNQADVSASLNASQGILFAVLHMEATGEGQFVDVSAQESMSMSQETAMQTWDMQKRNRTRTGGRGLLPIQLPGLGLYRASDGFVVVNVLAPGGADFHEFVDWMREEGKAEDLDKEPYRDIVGGLNMAYLTRLMADPASAATSLGHLNHVNDVVARFLATMPAKKAYETGQTRRLSLALVSTPKDLAENTQLRARDWFQRLNFEWLNAVLEFPGPPYNMSETPALIRRPPRLGEHTEQVLVTL